MIRIIGPYGVTQGGALIDLVQLAQEASFTERFWNEELAKLDVALEAKRRAESDYELAQQSEKVALENAEKAREKLALFLQSGVIL